MRCGLAGGVSNGGRGSSVGDLPASGLRLRYRGARNRSERSRGAERLTRRDFSLTAIRGQGLSGVWRVEGGGWSVVEMDMMIGNRGDEAEHRVRWMFHSTAMVADYELTCSLLGRLCGIAILEYSELLHPIWPDVGG